MFNARKSRVAGKKSIIFLFIAIFSFAFTNLATADDGGYCNSNYWYKTVKHGSTYQAGKDVYVKVEAQKHYDIQYMELYINGYKVRREMHAPYEWGRPNGGGDNYLRRLKPGTYRLKCIAKTRCGGQYKEEITIYVKQKGGGHNGNYCANNYKYLYGQHGSHCKAGKDLYVKVAADYNKKVEYMELYINGYKVRREMHAPYEWGRPNGGGDHYLRNMKRGTYQLKCKIKTKCGDIVWKKSTVQVY
ncbi:MAG: hypothetical protein AAF960_10760 [Bacteroidota bacterium]